jgi:hypothetical protein
MKDTSYTDTWDTLLLRTHNDIPLHWACRTYFLALHCSFSDGRESQLKTIRFITIATDSTKQAYLSEFPLQEVEHRHRIPNKYSLLLGRKNATKWLVDTCWMWCLLKGLMSSEKWKVDCKPQTSESFLGQTGTQLLLHIISLTYYWDYVTWRTAIPAT